MKTMLWEHLKKKALDATYIMSPLGIAPCYALLAGIENKRSWRANLETMQALVDKTIKAWDIRNAGKLIKLFPSIVPKKYQTTIPFVKSRYDIMPELREEAKKWRDEPETCIHCQKR